MLSPFIEIRRQLHQIPELGFQEYRTQAFILKYLRSLSADRVLVEEWETGLFVKVHGKQPSKTIAYRADIDGLPITEQNDVPFSSQHEGRMHACGHDFHMSIALGLSLIHI